MKVNITGHETVLTPEVRKYAEQKMNKLCKRYKQIMSADAVLEEDHNKKERTAATAKILLKLTRQDVSATSSERTVFAAIDEAERKLVKQLDREKSKYDPNNPRVLKGKKLLQKLFHWDQ